ncbi:MAG: phosphoribosyltransferase family protein [Anaerolineae bacterium]
MSDDVLSALPARHGHFLLESGYHTDLWLTLDALFVSPAAIAPRVANLAALLEPYSVTAVCGPLLGGAFLAEALAARMGIRFYFSEPAAAPTEDGLFNARYELRPDLRRRVVGERVAIVDDVISAGSSVRATAAALAAAGAVTVAVGTFLLLGSQAALHFAKYSIPVVSLTQQEFNLWPPAECPLCLDRIPLERPVA